MYVVIKLKNEYIGKAFMTADEIKLVENVGFTVIKAK